jgi:hypothetical protein
MTPEEQQEAQKLGFNCPKPTSNELPKTTDVVGYFNPNPWPVHVSISEFNLSFVLNNRGEYIVDPQGRKINDPVFERYVIANGLAREMSIEGEVPLLALAHRKLVASSKHGFSATMDVKRDKDTGNLVSAAPAAAPSPEVPRTNAAPVGGYTIEQAKKLGLINPTLPVPEDFGVPHNEVTRGNIPTIPVAHDVPNRRKNVVPQSVPVKPEAVAAPEAVKKVVQEIPATPEQKKIIEGLEAASSVDLDDPDIISKIIQTNPEMVTVANTPAPMPESATPSTASQVSETSEDRERKKFVCNVDGRIFYDRSSLEKYARGKYPDIADNIMAPYPKRRRGPPTAEQPQQSQPVQETAPVVPSFDPSGLPPPKLS